MGNKINVIKKKMFVRDSSSRADDLQMLFKRKNMEIMMQFIPKDATVWIEPAVSIYTTEFFYITKGEIAIIEDDEILKLGPGDSFIAENLDKKFLIKILEDVELLYFTNSNIYEDLNEFNYKIDAIINSIDEKDHYTKLHCGHVAYICETIYHGLDNKGEINYDQLVLAAVFHDVGKTYLPSEVLNYQGIYSKDQHDIMKVHIQNGYSIIQPLYGEEMGQIILQHHERLDGSGYLGMKGDEIKYESLIIAVADSFDAMTSPRTYKKVYTYLEAAEELLSMKDKYDEKITKRLYDLVCKGELRTKDNFN